MTLAFLALCIQALQAAENSAFVKFALKNAHERGFHGCDEAISTVFKLAGGDDMRVVTFPFPNTNSDSLRMAAAYGTTNDSIFLDVMFRKVGSSCYTSETSLLTSDESCTAYLANNPAFKYEAEAPGHIWAKNAGGVNMVLRPLGKSCVVTYQKIRKF